MSKIITTQIPYDALTAKYIEEGAFVDCYSVEIPMEITLDEYIKAFYTTSLFKIERAILSVITSRPATNSEAVEFSLGRTESYSIWTVESRSSNQILLCDFTDKTRSWLMVKTSRTEEVVTTRLFFGSVVIPKKVSDSGNRSFGILFHLFGGFHRIYSKALLNASYRNLLKNKKGL